MPRDYEVYLEDIRDAIGKIKRYTTVVLYGLSIALHRYPLRCLQHRWLQ